MIFIGADPGYINCKTAWCSPEGVRTAFTSAVVSAGELQPQQLPPGPQNPLWQAPHRVRLNQVTYLVGGDIEPFTPLWGPDSPLLADLPKLRAAFCDAAFRLLGAGEHQVAVLLGLPVAQMTNSAQAQATWQRLDAELRQRHYCLVNEAVVQLTVADLRVTDQPAGAYFAWGLDDQGQWTRPKDDLQAPVGVCDVGFYSNDLLVIDRGDVTLRATDGGQFGLHQAIDLLYPRAWSKYQIRLSQAALKACLHQKWPRFDLLPQSEEDLDARPLEVDLSALALEAVSEAAALALEFVARHWGNGQQFKCLLFTGGGAELLRPMLLKRYPHGTILPHPLTANAIGLARYAIRVFRETPARRNDPMATPGR